MKLTLLLAVVLGCLPVLRANEEDFLTWKTVTIKFSKEDTAAGAVSCEITTGDSGYANFTVHAFGKEYKLSAEELAKLKDFPLSELRTTYCNGQKEIGGCSLYFRFKRLFYVKDKLKTEVVCVVVSEIRGLQVGGARVE